MNKKTKIFSVVITAVCLMALLAVSCFADTQNLYEFVIDASINNGSFDYYNEPIEFATGATYTFTTNDGLVFTFTLASYDYYGSDIGAYYEMYDNQYGGLHTLYFGNDSSTTEPKYLIDDNSYETLLVESSAPVTIASGYNVGLPEVSNTEGILDVFTNMTTFVTAGLSDIQDVFYANNQLTMLGGLSVIAVAVGVAFLIIGIIQRFLALRG